MNRIALALVALAGMTSAALAQPVTLTEAQMDEVTAGNRHTADLNVVVGGLVNLGPFNVAEQARNRTTGTVPPVPLPDQLPSSD